MKAKIMFTGPDFTGKGQEIICGRKGFNYVCPVLVIPLDQASVDEIELSLAQVIADTYWNEKNAAVCFRDHDFAIAAMTAIGITRPGRAKGKR